jgi:hypothetical protein
VLAASALDLGLGCCEELASLYVLRFCSVGAVEDTAVLVMVRNRQNLLVLCKRRVPSAAAAAASLSLSKSCAKVQEESDTASGSMMTRQGGNEATCARFESC